MVLSKTFLILLFSLLLVGCGQIEEINMKSGSHATLTVANEQHEQEASYDEHLAFERKYGPIVEAEMKKRFPISNPTDTPFEKFGAYYIDTSDKNKMRYVFLIDQENAQEIKDLSAVLKAKMGEHVEFKKSKYSQLQLKAVSEEVVEFLEAENIIGGWGVSVDIISEKVKVEAYLDEAVQSELINKFGRDLVEIKLLPTGRGLAGYVIDKNEDCILVVNPNKLENKEAPDYAATWYDNAPSTVEIGNKVEVIVIYGPRILMAMYPDKDEALEVKVIENSKLEGAELAEFEAIRKAVFSEINHSTFVAE